VNTETLDDTSAKEGQNMKTTVYLISGPAGAGKSTTSRKIAERLEQSAYIEGDDINHMVIGGHEKPWLSPVHLELIWLNIVSLTKNFINRGHDVVIDYVTFNENLEYFLKELNDYDILIKFIVLIVDEEELLIRDSQRNPEDQMGERCIIGLHQIIEQNTPKKHIIDSTKIKLDEVIEEIIKNKRFLINALPGHIHSPNRIAVSRARAGGTNLAT
jgi:predicted kinase